jgi:hypothetical protein
VPIFVTKLTVLPQPNQRHKLLKHRINYTTGLATVVVFCYISPAFFGRSCGLELTGVTASLPAIYDWPISTSRQLRTLTATVQRGALSKGSLQRVGGGITPESSSPCCCVPYTWKENQNGKRHHARNA